MTITTVDRDEVDFGQDIDHWSRRGVPVGAVVALYNALNSANAATRSAARKFLAANGVGLGDPSNAEDAAARQTLIAAAERLAGRLHVAPPPASLRRMYLPTDSALSERLDRASSQAASDPLDRLLRDTSPRRLDFATDRADDIDLSNTAERPVNDGGPVGRQGPRDYQFGSIKPSVDTSEW